MSPAQLSKIPEEVREHVKMLLSVTSTVRPDADQMTKVCVVFEHTNTHTCLLLLHMFLILFMSCRLNTYCVFVWNLDPIF